MGCSPLSTASTAIHDLAHHPGRDLPVGQERGGVVGLGGGEDGDHADAFLADRKIPSWVMGEVVDGG
jgi:hypothetical protein